MGIKTLFGHRGAAGHAPENTLAGFAHARRLGVRAIELDVRLSLDGQLVVIHDAVVDRTTNATGRVADFTAAQLAGLDARRTCPAWPTPAGVPLLSQVLDAHHDLDAFQIEVKSDQPERLERLVPQVIAQIAAHGIGSRAVVTSFDATALEIVRRHAPEQERGFIAAFQQSTDLETALKLGCRHVCIPLAHSTREMVGAAHAHGCVVTGWLGNSTADLETLLLWDVDCITSDYPGRARPFLLERGWLRDRPEVTE